MSGEIVPVSVTILGKEYRVSCPPEEQQSLKASATYLSERMREIRDRGKVLGTERVAVMAALNIAHELLQLRESGGGNGGAAVEGRLREINQRLAGMLTEESAG